MGGYAPGYGSSYLGIAYQSSLDNLSVAPPLPLSNSIASPLVAPASNPMTFVTSGQQDQDVKTILNSSYAQAGGGAELGAPVPEASPVDTNSVKRFIIFGVLVFAAWTAATVVIFKR